MFRKLAIATIALSAFSAGSANATIFQTEYMHGAYKDAGVWTSYDTDNEIYSMKFATAGSDAFWLVVSDGQTPESGESEYAILYGDMLNNKITAYTYDADSDFASYESGSYLGTFDGAIQDAGTLNGYDMASFTLDTSEINAAFSNQQWDGVQFDETQSLWFRQQEDANYIYASDGSLANYSYICDMWLDSYAHASMTQSEYYCDGNDGFGCDPATALTPVDGPDGSDGATGPTGGTVPVPSGLAFILVAAAAAATRRKRAA